MESQKNPHYQEAPESSGKGQAAEALHEAVFLGSVEKVEQLLAEGVDINSRVNHGFTALHSAVQMDNEEMVLFLLEKGADQNARKDNGATPFIVAGIKGSVNLLHLFLDRGSDVNEYDNNGYTALMEAAWYGKKEAMKFLCQRGANVDLGRIVGQESKALKKGGKTALMDAARNGHISVARVLVEEMKADVSICDNQGRNALVHALSKIGDKERQRIEDKERDFDKDKEAVALFLLNQGSDVNKRDEYGKTTLILACEMQSQTLVKAILEKGTVDIDAMDKYGKSPLRVAVEKKNLDVARMLCEKGARPNKGNLLIARSNYDDKMIELLQQFNAMAVSHQPPKQCEATSKRWEWKIQQLHRKNCVTIGKLRIYNHDDFRIKGTAQGGVYLGFYDEEEVAVKKFHSDSENAKREKTCLEKCRTSNHLVKFCGWEDQKACLYVCLSLCERNLEEYFKEAKDAAMRSKDILTTVFQAVQELHTFGFGHQDLHPSNILIDVADKIFLADFDKCKKLAGDEKDLVIKEDLKALKKLLVYVAMRGTVSFENLPTECPEDVDDRMEIEDLRVRLSSFDENIQVTEQLEHLKNHPYFWSKQTKFRVLRDVGNESEIKKVKTNYQDDTSEILKKLNCEDDPFIDWTKKIDEDVLHSMMYPFSKRDKNKKKQDKKEYDNCVTGLLKFVRNLGEHFEEKTSEIKEKVKEPGEYLLTLFPDLPLYVYQRLCNTPYNKHFPNAQSPSPL